MKIALKMHEPSIQGVPFSLCSKQDLANSLLVPYPIVLTHDESGVSLEYAIDIAKRYAAKLIHET